MASLKKAEAAPPPPPDGKEVFIVERVLNHRHQAGRLEYLLQWRGYPPTDDTWEAHDNLYCHDLIKEYEEWRRKSSTPMQPGKALPNRPRKKPAADNKEESQVKVTPESAWSLRRRALRIIAATDRGDELAFLVEFQDWRHLELVPASEMNRRFPKVVIKYYEQLPCLKRENVTVAGSGHSK